MRTSRKTTKKTYKIKQNQRNYEHFDHQKDVTGIGAHKNKKKYTRKVKHKKGVR